MRLFSAQMADGRMTIEALLKQALGYRQKMEMFERTAAEKAEQTS